MTSAGGSSRLLVICCCVSLTSFFLYCVGFVRLELELRAYKERLVTLEQRENELATVRVPSIPTNGEYKCKVVAHWFIHQSRLGSSCLFSIISSNAA